MTGGKGVTAKKKFGLFLLPGAKESVISLFYTVVNVKLHS
jgi:hypothetical protein